jgi:hypothetical protein
MNSRESPLFAVWPASVAAGPIFVLSFAAASAFSLLPRPIPIDASVVMLNIIALVPSAIVGFMISILPSAIGAYFLSLAGETSETARAPTSWIGIGAALGFGLAVLFGAFPDSAATTFALVSTSSLCAGLCRARIRWED